MKKLIELDAAIKATWKDTGYTDPVNVMTAIRDRLEALPTVDAVPVRHGRWKRHYCEDDGLPDGWQCSVCGEWYYFGENKPNFCPNCGTKMDGGR